MTRVLKSDIDTIVHRAVCAAFDERSIKLSKEENVLILKVYNSIYSESERKHVKALDRKWFQHGNRLRLNIQGQQHNLHATGATEFALPCTLNNFYHAVLTGDLAETVLALAIAKENYLKERTQAERELRGVLSNVSTYKKLCELWPEGKKFYKDFAGQPDKLGNLPAIQFNKINEKLGLVK